MDVVLGRVGDGADVGDLQDVGLLDVELLRRLRLDVVEALGLDIAAERGASRL